MGRREKVSNQEDKAEVETVREGEKRFATAGEGMLVIGRGGKMVLLMLEGRKKA